MTFVMYCENKAISTIVLDQKRRAMSNVQGKDFVSVTIGTSDVDGSARRIVLILL